MGPISLAQDKIYVAGHRGLVGSSLMRVLQAAGARKLIARSHADLDLCDHAAVRRFFEVERPDHVILAAAKVGGIYANNTYPAEFIQQNLAIQNNVIHEAWRNGVQRLLFLGSSCIYPRDCPQPIKESYWMTGPLEHTNRAYATAKISGIEMCWAYNRQYGTRYLCAMPTNLYGPGDNYDLQNSHVLPALIRKMHEARINGSASVTVWGTGTPRREFLYVDDMARACLTLMGLPEDQLSALANPAPELNLPPMINIGCGEDLSVREIAETVAAVIGYAGQLVFDTGKPDGTPRKLLDISRVQSLGWQPQIDLKQGIALAYRDYLATGGHAVKS